MDNLFGTSGEIKRLVFFFYGIGSENTSDVVKDVKLLKNQKFWVLSTFGIGPSAYRGNALSGHAEGRILQKDSDSSR